MLVSSSTKGLGARLERAIYNFMLDEHGKEALKSPHLTWSTMILFGTGQYPKFKEDTFELSDTNYVLIPTAEVPFDNHIAMTSLMGKTFQSTTAMSPSFRP